MALRVQRLATAKLHTLNLPYPYARDDDTQPQAGRSSSADYMAYLRAEVAAIKARDKTDKVILIGSGRGGNAIRSYIQNGDGRPASATPSWPARPPMVSGPSRACANRASSRACPTS